MGMVMGSKKKPWENFIWCFAMGLVLTGISVLLFMVLGTDSVFVYHDQMDGEVLCYLYQAKYLFQDSLIPEFMNGAGKNALTPPAPFFVLFYKVLPPFAAFVASWYFSMLAGFSGMYLWLTRLKIKPLTSCLCSVLFAYLPLLPVYGLSMYGIPLAAWALYSLAETGKIRESKRKRRFRQAGLLLLLAAYAAASSFVLSGFAVLAAAFLVGLALKPAGKSKAYLAGCIVLLVSWLLSNQALFAQVSGLKGGYVTHKEEMAISAEPFFARFTQTFLYGMEHAQAYQKWIVLFAAGILAAGVINKNWRNREWKRMFCFVGAAFAVAFLCALYTWKPVVAARTAIGGPAVWFQLDRIYWLNPALWYTILGLGVQWLCEIRITASAEEKNGKNRIKAVFSAGILLAVLLATAVDTGRAGVWKDNIKAVLGRETSGISWKDFYAGEIYVQIEAYLYETTGQTQEDYRVVSLGICPAAALYNGFYCLDGYSNNYPLEYKHAFRQTIKPELDKSGYLTDYFDRWGNRCYLFSAEIPGYYTVEKGGFYFGDFEMDTEAFEKLGGTYVFSAAYIENAECTGLKLLREEPFSTEDSYYQIYVYGLIGENGD